MTAIEGEHAVPWLSKHPNFQLLVAHVHVEKCIRNNWFTEKTQQLKYTINGITQIAEWHDLRNLCDFERKFLVILSQLNKVSVFPKPIERQSVQTSLRVFCGNMIAALENSPNDCRSSCVRSIRVYFTGGKVVEIMCVAHAKIKCTMTHLKL